MNKCVFKFMRRFNKRNFKKADLEGLDLAGVDLRYVDIRDANLRHVNLDGASLYGAVLIGADLTGASVIGTNFTRSDMKGVTSCFGETTLKRPVQRYQSLQYVLSWDSYIKVGKHRYLKVEWERFTDLDICGIMGDEFLSFWDTHRDTILSL